MSYILEALRKAEQERQLGQPPNLQNIALPSPSSRPRPSTGLLALALLTNVAVLTALFAPGWRDRPSVDVPMNPAPLAPKPLTTEESVEPETASMTASSTAGPVVPTKPTSDLREAIPALASDPAESPLTKPVVARVKEHASPPLLRTLPADFQHSVPTLNLDVHVYSERPAERFVLINSKRYREGEQLREGPLLEKITLDGVVLSQQNRRFRVLVHQ